MAGTHPETDPEPAHDPIALADALHAHRCRVPGCTRAEHEAMAGVSYLLTVQLNPGRVLAEISGTAETAPVRPLSDEQTPPRVGVPDLLIREGRIESDGTPIYPPSAPEGSQAGSASNHLAAAGLLVASLGVQLAQVLTEQPAGALAGIPEPYGRAVLTAAQVVLVLGAAYGIRPAPRNARSY